MGVCDADCGDLDLALYDENGNLVSEDETTDDVPAVTVEPRWTGPFTLRVDMYQCTEEPCVYGFTVVGTH